MKRNQQNKQVTVYDIDTGTASVIPSTDLAPGMIQADLPGVGRVWFFRAKARAEILDMMRDVEFDRDITPDNLEYRGASVLVASVVLGPNERIIGRTLGYEPAFLAEVGNRLRQNGLWVGDMVNYRWSDPKSCRLEFFLDVAVAIGVVARSHGDPDAAPAYAATRS